MPPQPFNAEKWKAKGFDFICFVTHKGDMPDFCGVWYIEELPVSWADERLNAVMPKLNPQSVLDGYDYSVWLDSDIAIVSDDFYLQCKELQSRGLLYASVKDEKIRSVYDYAKSIRKDGLESFKTVFKAVSFLFLKGVRRRDGFHDTSVLFRKHEDDAVLEFDRWWWECLLVRAGGHYDRLMHVFALKDTPSLKWELVTWKGLQRL